MLVKLTYPTKFINQLIQDVHISLYVHFTGLKNCFDHQQAHEKQVSVKRCPISLIIKKNANQNYNEVSSHTSQHGHCYKVYKRLPWWSSDEDSLLPMWWALVRSLVRELNSVRVFMPQLKTLHAAAKTRCSQVNK